MPIEKFKMEIEGAGKVGAVFTAPEDDEPEVAVVVAHGQANDFNNELLVSFSNGLAERGYASLRFNFPYREAGKKSPNGKGTLVKAYKTARDELERKTEDAKIVYAGKSLGARIASYVAEEEPPSGLIFLGYPIHRPGGEPGNYAHLLEMESPMLFFAGTRDPFCNMEKLQNILELRTHPSSLQIVEGGEHSFIPPEGDDRPVEIIYRNIAAVSADWLDEYIS